MNKKLSINLILGSDCRLIASDDSDYAALDVDLSKHVMLEFLSFNDETSPIPDSIKVRKEKYNRGYLSMHFATEFVLKKDGTYSYYKLVVPILDHFLVANSEQYENLNDNELFVYDKKLYKSNIQDENRYTLNEVISNSDIIDNYIDAYEIVQNNGASQTFYCPIKKIFSVCKLQKCLVSLQRQLLFSNNSCNFDKCETDSTLRNRRDFLLSALFVFDYLKDTGNFAEAQRILDNLSTCESICADELGIWNNSCSCGDLI